MHGSSARFPYTELSNQNARKVDGLVVHMKDFYLESSNFFSSALTEGWNLNFEKKLIQCFPNIYHFRIILNSLSVIDGRHEIEIEINKPRTAKVGAI